MVVVVTVVAVAVVAGVAIVVPVYVVVLLSVVVVEVVGHASSGSATRSVETLPSQLVQWLLTVQTGGGIVLPDRTRLVSKLAHSRHTLLTCACGSGGGGTTGATHSMLRSLT